MSAPVSVSYASVCANLQSRPRSWAITGAAGFIGSNLVEALLRLGQTVIGLDNFSTGHRRNLDEVRNLVGPESWNRFTFLEADIRSLGDCRRAFRGVDHVLHQAALGSVPRSIEDPVASHDSNVTGFVNVLAAAKDEGLSRVVYASSSSVYGDDPELPKREDRIGRPLSPYAASKWVDEIYADVFSRCYAIETVGLRYFNVFGPRQDPEGAYAAVIPCWFAALARGESVYINGDGETSRDFCFVENVVQANILAATVPLGISRQRAGATLAAEDSNLASRAYAVRRDVDRQAEDIASHAFNVAVGSRTTLNELFELVRERVARETPASKAVRPVYRDFRAGDVRHSLADITLARQVLGYEPTHSVEAGLDLAAQWYLHSMPQQSSR